MAYIKTYKLSLKYAINQARRNKTFARKKLKDKKWMAMASEVSKEMVRKNAVTPIKQMARESYRYWKIRAKIGDRTFR